MEEKKPLPKKIKLPPLVDRSDMYDTLSFDCDTLPDSKALDNHIKHEDNSQNNSQGLQQLESDSTD